jgi:glucose/arabinose dehydrogenase
VLIPPVPPWAPIDRGPALGLAPAVALGLIVGLGVVGCSPSAPPAGSPAPPSSAVATSLAPTPSQSSAGPPAPPPSPSPTPVPSAAPGDPIAVRVDLERLVGGLDAPLFATGAGDGSGRLFVVEQGGRIRIVRDGRLLDAPFLDISDRVRSGGEQGLLGLAFRPGFGPDEARFYVNYTDRAGDTVIAEYRRTADPDRADPASERILLRIDQPFANHNGGMLAFGPDGRLYIGTGDGGSAGDPLDAGQRRDTLLGKLLRIDPDPGSTGPYRVPPDNPFVGTPGARPEIWALGLRNPWRFAFDRLTGQLWIADVGQGRYEEVNRAPDGLGRGANYGWARMEGRHCYPSGEGCARPGFVLPVAEYGHDLGCSVTGGYVYRGGASPALAGVYLFGDYCSGRLWGIASGGPAEQVPILLAETGRTISSFGQDDAGELYLTDLADGSVWRIVGSPAR